MDINNFKVSLDPLNKIILVEHPTKSVTLDNLFKLKEKIENSTKTKYLYGIVKRVPGYYFSYVLNTREPIILGRMDKTETVKETKEYAIKHI